MRAFVVTVPIAEAELAADALWSFGVLAVEERAVDDGTVELWTSLGDSDPASLDWPDTWPWRHELVDDDVVDTWREFARPVRVGEHLAVVPAWLDVPAEHGVLQVRIEPGSTFGLGDHPTTMLCLRALERLVRPGATVLDVGCGSGVLAITACLRGASQAVGVDISPAAVPVTTANAVANGVGEFVAVATTPLSEVEGQFDLVLANILAPTLCELAPDLRRVLAPGGRLVISGILLDRHQHVLEALAPLEVECTDDLDGWAAVTLRWPPSG